MMSKKVYINDSLINMRDRLRRNYESLHRDQPAGAEADVPVAPAEEVPERSPAPAVGAPPRCAPETAERRLPSIRRSGSDSQAERERRELEGRVIHDLSAAECEMELLKNRSAELERFRELLRKEHEMLLRMAEDEDDSKLSAIQAEYFAASGRWKAFAGEKPGPGRSPAGEATGSDRWSALLIAGSVLAGSIVIALVMVGLFGR